MSNDFELERAVYEAWQIARRQSDSHVPPRNMPWQKFDDVERVAAQFALSLPETRRILAGFAVDPAKLGYVPVCPECGLADMDYVREGEAFLGPLHPGKTYKTPIYHCFKCELYTAPAYVEPETIFTVEEVTAKSLDYLFGDESSVTRIKVLRYGMPPKVQAEAEEYREMMEESHAGERDE